MITGILYEETLGLVLTYFNANFRMYDPFYFQEEIWYHSEMNLAGDAEREKNYTFVTSTLSKKFGMLAIGGLEGRIFIYDLTSHFKIGMNEDIHKAEIIKIFFNNDQNQMISTSKDR